MNKNTILKTILICILLLTAGCASLIPRVQIEKVEVPIPVPCNIVPPSKPAMPFSDVELSGSLFTDSKRALAEIQLRIGYELQLEAAIKACNSK